jgi:hypothetical protein
MMTGFEHYTRKTRRAIFLEEMEQVVPWHELCALVERIIPSLGRGGRRWEWNACCGFTFCSSGLTCRTRLSKRRCTTGR